MSNLVFGTDKSDDTIWFTDPPSGISGNYLGVEAKPELPLDVYRLEPKSGVATVATTGLVKPIFYSSRGSTWHKSLILLGVG